MGLEVSEAPTIDDHTLEMVQLFTYLGLAITSNLSLSVDIYKRIGRAASVISRISKRMWENSMLTEKTKVRLYQASVLNTLLYGSEAWTTYVNQEIHLNSFLLGFTYQVHTPNKMSLSLQTSPGCSLFKGRRLRWLGHSAMWRTDLFERTSSMVNLSLVQGVSAIQLCCSRLQQLETGCVEWYEEGRRKQRNKLWTEKRELQRERLSTTVPLYQTVYACTICNRDCH